MKKILIIGLVGLMALNTIACSKIATAETEKGPANDLENSISKNVNDKDDNALATGDEDYFVTQTDDISIGEVITVGEIMAFDKETIHIISGDLVQVYNFDTSQASAFYLNQKVQLLKGEGQNILESYIVDDFSQRYTNMGHILTEIKGVIKSVTGDEIVINNDVEDLSIQIFQPIEYVEGTNVTLYHMTFAEGEEPSLVSIYNEDSKLKLTVKSIDRSPSGEMTLDLEDASGGAYNISTSGCTLELNISEIALGDDLTVYHEGIMESWPMQLVTTLIRK